MSMVPKIRFPEFEDELTDIKLGDIGPVSMCKRILKEQTTPDGDIPFYKIGTFGRAPDAFIDREIFEEYSRRYSYPKQGDVLISAAGTIGRLVVFDGVPSYFQDSNIVWIANAERLIKNSYLFYFLQTVKWTTEDTTIARLYNDNLRGIEATVPSLPEQQKIASFLSAVDKKIDLLRQKKEKLETYKKGLMQKIFSQEIRFKADDGSDFPDWENVALSEVLREHRLNSDGTEKVHSVSVHKGLIDQVEHLGRSFAAADTGHYNRVLPGDVVYTKSPTGDFPMGIIKQNNLEYPVIVSPLYGVFTPETEALGYILHCYFSSPVNLGNYLSPLVQKGAKNTIAVTNARFLEGALVLPRHKVEQAKIAAALKMVGNQISLHDRILSQAETFKKGLLQQMFV